ncbi:hypothetical protein B0J17DRAFT_632871 [Rhizoctonia solani]|nr:hypothetical protein B0J17DRAFT_632871 [Rhizoctonia solani]
MDYFKMVNPHITIDSARYRPKLLGVTAINSFVSATWAAANPFSLCSGSRWEWSTFSLIFVPRVILEWRLDIRVGNTYKSYIGSLANGLQAAIVLESVANPDRKFWSNWGVVQLTSIISLIALTTHLALPIIPDIWRVLVFVESLPPAYSTHPAEHLEVWVQDETAIGPGNSLEVDTGGAQNYVDSPKETQKA